MLNVSRTQSFCTRVIYDIHIVLNKSQASNEQLNMMGLLYMLTYS
jgi:hypothetical protein